MTHPADFQLRDSDRGRTAVLTGDWTAVDMGTANERLAEVLKGSQGVILDLNHVDRFDTSGAYGVLRAARNAGGPSRISAPANIERLLDLVHTATQAEPTPHIRRRSFHQLFERIGRGVIDIGLSVVDTLVFNGHLLIAVGRAIRNPRRVRWAAVIDLMERAGLDAIPVIATTAGSATR